MQEPKKSSGCRQSRFAPGEASCQGSKTGAERCVAARRCLRFETGFLSRKKPADWVRFALVWGAGLITAAVLLYLIVFILIKGIPHIKPSLFAVTDPDKISLFPPLVTTVVMVGLTLLIAVPFGVFTAIYMAEYAPRGGKPARAVRMTAETLSGIPSIVFGLFGYIFFAGVMGWGKSVMTGCFTLAIMILPLIMRTTEESLKAIPDAFREGSFGLGAGRMRTVFRVILPSATPGIFAGVILAVGRIVGETAALIFTIGDVFKLPDGLFSAGRTLAMHVLKLSGQGFNRNEAYATAVVLLALVIGINALSSRVERRFLKKLM